MPSFVSPGAYGREIDLSLFIETSSNTSAGLVGLFNKGPLNTRTLITNLSQLIATFGKPIDNSVSAAGSQAWFAAREFLRHSNKLHVTRVESAATPAAYAAQSIQGSSEQTLATDTDGVTSVPATRTLTSAGGDFVNDGVVVGDVLEVHEGGADDGFYSLVTVAATVLTIERDWPTGSLSNQDFTVWSAKKASGSNGATSVPATRTLTSAGAVFTATVSVGDIIVIDDSSSDEDDGVYEITNVAATVLTVDRDWPVGSLTSLTFDVYGNNSSGADGSTAVAGEFSSAGAKFQDHGVQAGDILRINDSSDPGANGDYMITGLKSGSEDTVVEVNAVAWPESLTSLDFDILPGAITFQSATKGTATQGYTLTAKPNAADSENFNLQVKDTSGFVQETIVALDRSNVVARILADSALFTAVLRSNRGEPVIEKAFTVSGGDDGYTGVVDADFIGLVSTRTGLQSFRNKEEVDIDILMIPGQTSQNIGDALIDMASEVRGDAVALVDPPDWATIDTVQEILNWSNGTGSLGRTTALDNSFSALYWTWVQVYDEFHDQDIWTAPSGHAAAVYAQNDNAQFPWFAPAGLKRGKLKGAKDLRLSPDQGDRDSLQESGQVVNPFVNFTGRGIHVWGQKTTQRASTALNRVNVRRMLNYVRRSVETAVRELVFDPNDEVLWREFKQLVEPLLRFVLTNRGIREFLVVADESINTPSVVDQNKMIGRIFIKPTKSAEIIEVQFVITAQTANFQELLVEAA